MIGTLSEFVNVLGMSLRRNQKLVVAVVDVAAMFMPAWPDFRTGSWPRRPWP